jgi:ABC-type glucose/galactose transport system permease subunit
VKLSKILTYVAIAFVIWWVIQQPTSAAHLVHNIGTLLSEAAHGLSSFVASL